MILRIGQVLGLLLAVFMLVQCVLYFQLADGRPSDRYGSIGLPSYFRCATDHFCPVTRILTFKPNPATEAGIRVGDEVRFDRRVDTVRARAVGETIGLTVRTGEAERHVVLTGVTSPPMWAPTYLVSAFVSGLIVLIGGFVVLRGWRRPAVLLVGLAYICNATPGGYPRDWQNAPELYPFFFVFLNLTLNASTVLFLAAVRLFRNEATGQDPVWLRALVWFYFAFQLVSLVAISWTGLNATSLPLMPDAISLQSCTGAIGAVLTLAVLASGLPSVRPEERTRYRFMVAALGVTSLYSIIDPVIMFTGNNYVALSAPVVLQIAAALIGVLLFAYATLRHKVVDLGFAVNRTLVYGVLSTVLLFGFWFCEWGLEEIIPAETREANILISAGIAFAIFLTFHHVRDWVEKAIEHLFFRAWRDNEARLKRFLKEAAFVTRPDALRDAAVAEFARFGQGATAALYEADTDGMVLRAGGSPNLPERLAIDAPVLVRLRAGREALQDDPALPAGAALALPTLYRNELTGVFLVSAKPGDAVWRPDEKTLLADAALRIGLDLHALAVEALKAEKARESQRADILAAELRHALAAPAAA